MESTTADLPGNESLLASEAQDAPVGNLSDWLTARRFALSLLVLIIGFFPEIVFGAKTFVFRDYALFGYPLAHYNREAFWRGEIPLWNPLSNCGIPYVAQWNTMFFYPLSLVYLLLPMPWSLGWFCLLHLFLAGLGMYCLACRWTNNRLAASVAGIAFAFSGLTLSCLIWPNDIAALGLLPWVWLWVERGWNRGGGALAKAVAVGAVQMLSGAPEVILFTWVLVGVLWLSQLFSTKGERRQILVRFVLIVLLVAGISAVQLLPFLDLLKHSHRAGQTVAETNWSMPPWGWASLLVPLFRASRSPMGVFLQESQAWVSSYYLGIGPLLLALLAVWKVRRSMVWLCGIMLGLSLILALGEAGHLFDYVRKVVPQITLMRYPVKLVVFAAALAPLLAAFAISAWQQTEGQERREVWISTVLLAVTGLGLIAVTVWFSFRYPGQEEEPGTTLVSGLTRGAILILLLPILFALRHCIRPRSQVGAQIGLLVIVAADLFSHTPNQNPSVEAQIYKMTLPPLAEMNPRPRPGESRALLSYRALEKFHTTILSNSFEAVLGLRLGLYDNCNLLENIPKIDGFYSLYLPEERDVRFRLYPSTNTVRPALADFLGVSQLTSSANLLDWQSREGWMPMITAGQRPEFADGEKTLSQITAGDFNPRKLVYLPLEAKGRVTVSNNVPAHIVRQSFSPHRISIEVESHSTSMLVVAQAFYHRWKAKVDGKSTMLWRANHSFQAVEVPSGLHRVELLYEDEAFRYGALISAATLLGCVASALWLARRRGTSTGFQEEPQREPR